MRDLAGQPLGSSVPVERWEEIARTYGRLQVAAVPHADVLPHSDPEFG